MTTQADIRHHLLNELNQVLGVHAKIEAHLHNTNEAPPADSSERATFRENDEVLDALDGRQRERIVALRGALERLDAGTYGTCAGCGEPIAKRRLQAIPETPVCIDCTT